MTVPRILFTYWGRRGPISNLALEIGGAAQRSADVHALVSVSRQNEIFGRFAELGPHLAPVDTFETGAGALRVWRALRLRRHLAGLVARERIEAVVELMPHVWSPLVMPALRPAGARYVTIVHDAQAHPGDRTSWANAIMDRCVPLADRVVTLSASVATKLVQSGRAPAGKVSTSFHPDLTFRSAAPRLSRDPGGPARLLFLGRILPYKGLPLFLDMVEILRGRGMAVEFGVFGEGPLGAEGARISRLGGEMINRWLADDEIAELLPRFDAIVLSHTEASQSGVAAAAFGAGLPIVATPVGGLAEQVQDGETGAVAARVEAGALADAAQRLFAEPAAYEAIAARIRAGAAARSVDRFLGDMIAIARRDGPAVL